MDEAVKEINQIINEPTTIVKKSRGRPKEWKKCKACKKFYKENQVHICQVETEPKQEATT